MVIRKATKKDTDNIFKLVVKTYSACNRNEGAKEATQRYIKQFKITKKNRKEKQESLMKNPIIFVLIDNQKIIGVIKGNKNKISNLFVDPSYHKKGAGRKLVEKFEREAKKRKTKIIKIRSSLFAVEFYKKMGYKKTTGIRSIKELKFQPMKKNF